MGREKAKSPLLISPKSGEIRMGHSAMGAFVRGAHASKIAKHGAADVAVLGQPHYRISATKKKTAE